MSQANKQRGPTPPAPSNPAERLTTEKAEADRLATEKAEADRLATEKAEADRLTTEKAEADRLADPAAKQNSDTLDDDDGGAGGVGQGAVLNALPAAGAVPKRGPVRILGKSATRAVVTDDVETWTVDLADGDPKKAVAPSLKTGAIREVAGEAVAPSKPKAPDVIHESATHRVLDDGVNRWKEAKA